MSELYDKGARVVSVGGAFNSRTLVEMPTELAGELFDGLPTSCPDEVVGAVRGDLAKMPDEIAASGMAMVALALARELQDPFNSATSKALCAARVTEILGELQRLAPPKQEADGIDRIAAQRKKRRAAVGG